MPMVLVFGNGVVGIARQKKVSLLIAEAIEENRFLHLTKEQVTVTFLSGKSYAPGKAVDVILIITSPTPELEGKEAKRILTLKVGRAYRRHLMAERRVVVHIKLTTTDEETTYFSWGDVVPLEEG